MSFEKKCEKCGRIVLFSRNEIAVQSESPDDEVMKMCECGQLGINDLNEMCIDHLQVISRMIDADKPKNETLHQIQRYLKNLYYLKANKFQIE